MMIPIIVSYDLESIATINSLPEYPKVHVDVFDNNFFSTDSYYNKLQCYKRSITINKSKSAYSVTTLYKC